MQTAVEKKWAEPQSAKCEGGCAIFSQALELLKDGWQIGRRHAKLWAAGLIAVTIATWLLWPYDERVLNWVQLQVSGEGVKNFARQMSYYGDFHTGTLFLCGITWLTGRLRKSALLQRTAVAALIAASLAGLSARGISMIAGRPRPYMEEGTRISGPNFSHHYNSFPSGHTATAMGTAVALSVAAPVLSPTVAVAALVIWSRLELDRHYPTDALMGIFLALTFAVPLGLAARRT